MRKQVLLITALLLMAVSGLMAQAPNIEWAKCFGGTGLEKANSIQQTNDSGYIIAGLSNSNNGDVSGNHGFYDYWVVKLDSSGNIQWQKSFGGSKYDEATSIIQTFDNGYIVAGFSNSNDGNVSNHHNPLNDNYDFWIVKLDSIGNLLWEKSLGGNADDKAFCIQQTNDTGYVITGFSYSNNGNATNNHGLYDYWVVKLGKFGYLDWQNSLGGSDFDWANSIQQTYDKGYIVAGCSKSLNGDVTENHGDFDYWVVKLDSMGIFQWQKSLGGSSTDEAYYVQQTIDSGYIVAGYTRSNDSNVYGNHGYYDSWIVKLNTNGTFLWQKCLGGIEGEMAYSIKQSNDGGFIVAGSSGSNNGDVNGNHGSGDFWLVRLDTSRVIQWQKCVGGSSNDELSSMQLTKEGGYILAGSTLSFDGDVSGNHGNYSYNDYWVVKLSKESVGVEELPTTSISIFPNPTTGIITIKGITQPSVAVYNLMGQKVVVAQGCNEVNLAQLPAGMYMVQVFNKGGELVKSEKVILNR